MRETDFGSADRTRTRGVGSGQDAKHDDGAMTTLLSAPDTASGQFSVQSAASHSVQRHGARSRPHDTLSAPHALCHDIAPAGDHHLTQGDDVARAVSDISNLVTAIRDADRAIRRPSPKSVGRRRRFEARLPAFELRNRRSRDRRRPFAVRLRISASVIGNSPERQGIWPRALPAGGWRQELKRAREDIWSWRES